MNEAGHRPFTPAVLEHGSSSTITNCVCLQRTYCKGQGKAEDKQE